MVTDHDRPVSKLERVDSQRTASAMSSDSGTSLHVPGSVSLVSGGGGTKKEKKSSRKEKDPEKEARREERRKRKEKRRAEKEQTRSAKEKVQSNEYYSRKDPFNEMKFYPIFIIGMN